MNKNIIIDFEPISRRVFLSGRKTAFELLHEIGISIKSFCGGKGSCGKCKVLVEKGLEYTNQSTASEKKNLSVEELKDGWRLACQCVINGEINANTIKGPQKVRIYLPDELLLEDFNILTSGINREIKINPTIKKIYIKVDEPSLESPLPDLERILASLIRKSSLKTLKEINVASLRKIPSILRKNNHEITLSIWNDCEIIDCEGGNTTEDNYGIAFDIGTTTIVGYLINLEDGKIRAIGSRLNPQTAFGEDVIARIYYGIEKKKGLALMKDAVDKALNDIIHETCSVVGILSSQIYEASVVGNPVMHHIFLGVDPIHIGRSPYVPVFKSDLNIKAREINLNICPFGNVYIAPLIAGFVGADTMGVMISSEIEQEEDLTLAIDIGTNGEIIVGNQKNIITSSCAAGSALEGAHIKNGMRAAAGAIDTVKIDPRTYEVDYTTIYNKNPIGICGSGLIDLIAELLKVKLLTRSGNFNKEFLNTGHFVETENGAEFVVVKKKHTNLKKAITISLDDVRQIQMAKGAFYSGAKIILNYLNQLEESKANIEQIFLAGAFGNYISKENARFIGMIPDIPIEKIFQIGNAAGIGAQYLLINKDLRKKALNLSKQVKYLELASRAEFQREFAEAMYFPHFNLNNFKSLREYIKIPKR
ncbi:MAG: DUF4445 domain-containing protein [Candidatus Lokiarchaeota archaeon]|nr:DUF4445 domain-containing protein [Candidatus Lokiarchaeota archaeon]